MEKPDKCYDLSEIQPSQISLNKGDSQFKVGGYRSSKIFKSLNLILLGERWNPEDDIRSALLTVINFNSGKLIGKDCSGFFWFSGQFQTKNNLEIYSIEEVLKNRQSHAFVTGDGEFLSIWSFSTVKGGPLMGKILWTEIE